MRVLVWNCQGVGSPLTIPQLREVNNLSSPDIVFLCETKNRSKYLEKVKNILRFDEVVIVDAMNKAGGMAILWREEIRIKQVLKTAFTIEAQIEDKESRRDWWFIGIYASSDDQDRKQQWLVLQARKVLWGERWIMAGDFNDIVSNEEKWGGTWRDEGSFKAFKNFINDNQLMDIGFEGHPWTWCNNWEGEGEIKQRLDRGLCSYPWLQVFDKVKCKHLDSFASDHSMLLIDTHPTKFRRKKRFYFDKRWLQRDEVLDVVRQAWDQRDDGSRMFKVMQKVKRCRVNLLKWNSKIQGNSKQKIEQIKDQMQQLNLCDAEVKRERKKRLKNELKEAYRDEEIY
ncbi:uncharacterized protein [Coffea arabica]|uniref:Endonuclease/exonuclease/phosphatase domain-containing protein n=1 Tax=Coffea arabica TaxID=13443 RepID=A0ABM4U1E6_COFAR